MSKVPPDYMATLPARPVMAGGNGIVQDDKAEAPEPCIGFSYAQAGNNIGGSEGGALEESGQILERNGIWVVTIDGTWRGDYIKREHAIAAVAAAARDRR